MENARVPNLRAHAKLWVPYADGRCHVRGGQLGEDRFVEEWWLKHGITATIPRPTYVGRCVGPAPQNGSCCR